MDPNILTETRNEIRSELFEHEFELTRATIELDEYKEWCELHWKLEDLLEEYYMSLFARGRRTYSPSIAQMCNLPPTPISADFPVIKQFEKFFEEFRVTNN